MIRFIVIKISTAIIFRIIKIYVNCTHNTDKRVYSKIIKKEILNILSSDEDSLNSLRTIAVHNCVIVHGGG